MNTNSEPGRMISKCAYCGDAAVNHRFFYILSLVSGIFDSHIVHTTSRAPKFFRTGVDWLIHLTFETMLLLGIATLSDDIEGARTFRSRVAWEEARRRGIEMKQVMLLHKPSDQYLAIIGGKRVFFDSLPIPPKLLVQKNDWDNKFVLKKIFIKEGIPAPRCEKIGMIRNSNLEKVFFKFNKPVIVKPSSGSRGRHTVTNIHTLEDFQKAVRVAREIAATLVAEEHLEGYVCRATFVQSKLMGFYRGGAPYVVGDGKSTVIELIEEKDHARPERVERVVVGIELEEHIARSGATLADVLPEGKALKLYHRTGRLFGGFTREMLAELHPSFVPVLTKAAEIVGLPVIGFDIIVPDPTLDAAEQRWGIIECNTLPFIDLHYYALEGKPENIAGAIWDLWR